MRKSSPGAADPDSAEWRRKAIGKSPAVADLDRKKRGGPPGVVSRGGGPLSIIGLPPLEKTIREKRRLAFGCARLRGLH